MLELRPNCECCDQDLPADTAVAYICSFECTFCAQCNDQYLHLICPNCGGELVRRPRRPAAKLAANPGSIKRVFNPAASPLWGHVCQPRLLRPLTFSQLMAQRR